jgi:hypothetical protein
MSTDVRFAPKSDTHHSGTYVIVFNTVHCQGTPAHATRASHLQHRSLPVDSDIFFAAATGGCKHYADTNRDHDSDQSPCSTDAGQNTQFPERSEKATNQDNITKKINTCPFHDKPRDEIRPL